MNPPVPDLPDRYKVLGKLGSGGMGTVYKVRDQDLNNIVALKVLHLSGISSNDQIVRFNKEARACARMRHPNIITILDFGFFQETTPYMVLEYVEGQTLRTRLSQTGPLSPHEAVHVFAQLISALSHAHSQNIIHRDLKSSNILIADKDGEPTVKLFDFGIAKTIADDDAMKLTASHAFIGTPTHMSPEQINNQDIDARSDIYSLGCVMFEAITGRLPFSAPDIMRLVELQLHQEAPKIGSIIPERSGGALETIVDNCLKKDPEERYQSADEILYDLVAHANEESTEEILSETPRREEEKRRSRKTGLLVAISSALLLFSWMFFEMQNPTTNEPVQLIDWKKLAVKKGERPDEVHVSEIRNFEDVYLKQIPNDGTVLQVDVSSPQYAGGMEGHKQPLNDRGFEYISELTKLTGIRVHGSHVTKKAIQSLAKLENLAFLDAKGTTFDDTGDLANLKHLKEVVFSKLTAKDVLVLSKLKIKHLELTNVKIDQAMIEAICEIKTVVKIVFNSCEDIDGAALEGLNKSKSLSALWIERSENVAKNGISAITKLKNITNLRLKGDDLSDHHAADIAKMIWLESLLLQNNPNLTDTGLGYLSKITALKHLNIEGCSKITQEGIDNFNNATHGRCLLEK